MVDAPSDVKEKGSKATESAYKKGHTDGKAEGQKMSKDKFSIEVNSMGTSVVNAKGKDGYKAPTVEDVGKKAQSIFGIGKSPKRGDLKALALTTLKAIEAMPIEQKKPTPKPSS